MISIITRAKSAVESLSPSTILRFIALLSGVACFASTANATVLSGSFGGAAQAGDSFLSLPAGTPITGTFKLDLGYPFTLAETDGSTFAHYEAGNFSVPPDPVHITFAAPTLGYNWDFDGLGFLNLYLYQTATGQRISFGTAYPGGSGADVTLAGGLGAFFQNFDLASVHGGPIDARASSAQLHQIASINNTILFTSAQFDPAVPVPEPQSGLLALAGLGMLWAGNRARNRQNCKQR